MLAPDASANLAQWARASVLKSIRPYLQDLENDAWILKRELDPAVQAMIGLGLRFVSAGTDIGFMSEAAGAQARRLREIPVSKGDR